MDKRLPGLRKFTLLLALAVLIRVFSLFPDQVERYFTYGLYPLLSRSLRFLTGWLPFSLGDLGYAAAFFYVVVKIIRLIRLLQSGVRRAKSGEKGGFRSPLRRSALRLINLILGVYIFFNLAWGLNYDRRGIASQLGLEVKRYPREELFRLTAVLQQRLNQYAALVDTAKREELKKHRLLFRVAAENYRLMEKQYPFLAYRHPSMKPSLYSPVGHYFGFSGYINPFTNEAQINTHEPVFTLPFVAGHEIAHQVGYGKENEASFVSYLVCKGAPSIDFRYSLYYELYFNAFYECMLSRDTAFTGYLRRGLHPRVKRDKWEEIKFRLRRKNRMEPYVSDFYNSYLKLNRQPHGLATYDEVTAWLIAYMKKFGEDSL